MKKLLLVSFAVSLCLGASAQNQVAYPPSKKLPMEQLTASKPAIKLDASVRVRKGGTPTTQAVGTVNLATGPNAFGSIAVRTQVWADPSLNAITFIHRNDPAVNGGSSGDFRFDYSNDGGTTWTIDNGRCYTSSGSNADPSIAFSIARYPQGGISNPTGNTIADSAFMSWYGPSRDGSNPDANGGDWGGHVYGSYNLAGIDTGRQEEVHSDPLNGYFNLIPRGYCITKAGTCFNLDYSVDFTNTGDYTDNLILTKGVWNNTKRDYDYTKSLVYVPVELDNNGGKLFTDYKLSMADNGMDGYISVIGHDSWAFSQDSVNYLTVYKTTDGGTTWNGPYDVLLHNVDPLLLNAGAGTTYTTGFEHDAVVDVNGNLHMVVAVGPNSGAGFSIGTAAGEWGIFDVYTTNGGTSWCAKLIGSPQTFRGTFGDPAPATDSELNEDSRPQVSRTWNGDKLFFSWFDTDTTTFVGLGNVFPNWFCVGYDVATGNTTAVTNFTGNTSADASAMFANVSYYVLDNAGTYTIPAVYCLLSGTAASGAPLGTASQTNFTYVSGATFADADFTNPTTCTSLLATSVGIPTQTAGSVTVSNNYPNPVTGATTFDIFLLTTSNVSLEVTNVLGQVMFTSSYSNMSGGKHKLTIDASKYAAGVYNYTVKVADFSVTKQMVVK